MPHRGLTTALSSLRVLLAASILLPAVLFVYASWLNYLEISKNADERVAQAVDIVQEQVLKVFETIELTLDDTNDTLADLSDDDIRAREAGLHDKLKRIADRLPQTGNILVIDKAGHLLVASSVFPAPRELSFADRDYFKLNAAGRVPPFVSDLIAPRLITPLLFNISVRRTERDGQFNGIVAAGILPNYFSSFYQEMSGGLADYFSLVRDDGSILVRYPSSSDRATRFAENGSFKRAIEADPKSGQFSTVSPRDKISRRIVYQKVPNYPIYAVAGIESAAIWAQWRAAMYNHLIFGLPATFLLVVIGFLALQRTREAQEEADRREAVEAALRQAQRLEALGQLTGGVAHDFNNLLMIFAAAERMLRRPASEENWDKIAATINQAVERGQSLTRQLLSFARRQALNPVNLDLAELLPRMRETLHATLRGNVEVLLDLPAGIWPVFADPNELEFAILNLAVNARDAMAGGGRFSITARNVVLRDDPKVLDLNGEFVAVACADTGAGIEPAVLPRIFEPFFTTKEIGKGTGVGLSQVYGFAKQSGGTVTVESEVGRGASFTLYLPRGEASVLSERQKTDMSSNAAGPPPQQ
jgi:two-component system, NtrC family, sensor kinase